VLPRVAWKAACAGALRRGRFDTLAARATERDRYVRAEDVAGLRVMVVCVGVGDAPRSNRSAHRSYAASQYYYPARDRHFGVAWTFCLTMETFDEDYDSCRRCRFEPGCGRCVRARRAGRLPGDPALWRPKCSPIWRPKFVQRLSQLGRRCEAGELILGLFADSSVLFLFTSSKLMLRAPSERVESADRFWGILGTVKIGESEGLVGFGDSHGRRLLC
jgi:hypothetical protein